MFSLRVIASQLNMWILAVYLSPVRIVRKRNLVTLVYSTGCQWLPPSGFESNLGNAGTHCYKALKFSLSSGRLVWFELSIYSCIFFVRIIRLTSAIPLPKICKSADYEFTCRQCCQIILGCIFFLANDSEPVFYVDVRLRRTRNLACYHSPGKDRHIAGCEWIQFLVRRN